MTSKATSWLRKIAVLAAVPAAFALAGASGSVAAASTVPQPPSTSALPATWAVSHGTASSQGTAAALFTQVFFGGSLTNTGAGCYFTRVTVYEDFTSTTRESDRQCGAGTTPVNLSFPLTILTTQAEVKVCRTGSVPTCGPSQFIDLP